MIVALISPDESARTRLQMALGPGESFEAIWSLSNYPDTEALEALVEQRQGCVVALDFTAVEPARRIANAVASHRHIRIVALNATIESGGFAAATQSGIRDILGTPFSAEELTAAIRRAVQHVRNETTSGPAGDIHAFLPARPGAGATTIAMNTAAAIHSEAGASSLLIDFDLRLGLSSFLLKLDCEHSVAGALELAPRMDEVIWEKLMSERAGFHILGSAPMSFRQTVPLPNFDLLLRYAQQRYANVSVDLPGNMDDHETLTLQRARTIVLICVPDVSGLHMARGKLQQLQDLDLTEKTLLVLNQVGGRKLFGEAEVTSILGRRAQFIIPYDEAAIAQAVNAGAPVRAGTKFARAIAALTKELANTDSQTTPQRKLWKFIDFFSVSAPRLR